MKGLMVLLLCVVAAPVTAQTDADDPVAVVESLFAAMKAGDADAMAALMHEDVRLVTTAERDGVPRVGVVEVDGWLASVGRSTRELDEQLYGIESHVNQGLASVWTRYDLFVDGEFSHCGVDAFILVLTEDGWRILSIADTRTTEGCRRS